MTTQQTQELRAVKPKRKIRWEATEKQQLAFYYLSDEETNELLYGGAAGGAKSFLGCAWIIINCHRYPGSRWLLGRAVLKQLKQSTLLTFFDVCRKWGLKNNVDYKYNAQEGIITFIQTGSDVYLKDLAYYPSDPEYDSLGSTEFTGAFIDEASQITEKCKNVVKSRLRYRIDEFGIKPKLLMTCNPTKNFLYTEFYKPWKAGELPTGKKFIIAKVEDNPFLTLSYIANLRTLDVVSQERLLKGNWEYDDDPAALMDFDSITDIFTNTVEGQVSGNDDLGKPKPDIRPRYISCDVARFGEDRTVIAVWKGLECVAMFTYKKTSTLTVANLLKEKMKDYNVPASHVIVDEDGIGGGVKDQLYGIKGFIANTRPFLGQNYTNLKSQCAYKLASLVVARELAVRIDDTEIRASLIEELEQIKAKDIDKDGKNAITSKDSVKESIGRSPDISDTLMMRMYFEFAPTPRLTFV
jgi:hypothetical protein